MAQLSPESNLLNGSHATNHRWQHLNTSFHFLAHMATRTMMKALLLALLGCCCLVHGQETLLRRRAWGEFAASGDNDWGLDPLQGKWGGKGDYYSKGSKGNMSKGNKGMKGGNGMSKGGKSKGGKSNGGKGYYGPGKGDYVSSPYHSPYYTPYYSPYYDGKGGYSGGKGMKGGKSKGGKGMKGSKGASLSSISCS